MRYSGLSSISSSDYSSSSAASTSSSSSIYDPWIDVSSSRSYYPTYYRRPSWSLNDTTYNYRTGYRSRYSTDTASTLARTAYISAYYDKSDRTGSYGINSSPSHDQYGRELSNYERWKLLRSGESRISNNDPSSLKNDFSGKRISSIIEPIATDYPDGRESRAKTVDRTTFSSLGDAKQLSTFRYMPPEVREKLNGYTVRDVRGDGGCYYRCLSCYFTGSESSYNKYRREVMSYIRDNLENYSSMIKSEVGYASTSDYFSRKTRTDRQEFAETTEIIATCVVYDINVHVLAVVPGKRNSWEWLHFDPSIGSGKPSYSNQHIYLYNQGSVHFQLCTPK